METKEVLRQLRENMLEAKETDIGLTDFLETIIRAVEREEKYSWHDLRENPKDLPEGNRPINLCIYYEEEETYEYCSSKSDWILRMKKSWEKAYHGRVIGWSYIEEMGKKF